MITFLQQKKNKSKKLFSFSFVAVGCKEKFTAKMMSYDFQKLTVFLGKWKFLKNVKFFLSKIKY